MNLDLISSKYCWTLDIIGVDCNELVHVCVHLVCAWQLFCEPFYGKKANPRYIWITVCTVWYFGD
jgi:hypothetical protein